MKICGNPNLILVMLCLAFNSIIPLKHNPLPRMTPAATPINVPVPTGNQLDVIEKRNVSASRFCFCSEYLSYSTKLRPS